MSVKIFISYSSQDRDFVLRLAEALRDAGYDVWLDVWRITGREPYWDEIQTGIEACTHFVFVVSPRSLDKQSAARLELFHAASLKPMPQLIPVVAESVPFDDYPIVISPGLLQIHSLVGEQYAQNLPRLLQVFTASDAPTQRNIPINAVQQTETQQRKLEAAMPRQSQAQAPTEVRVKVSLPDSIGLRAELPDFTQTGDIITKDDVRSSTFPIEFPIDPHTGKPTDAHACLQIDSPDFEVQAIRAPSTLCDDHQVEVNLPPEHDSRTVIFDLVPKTQRTGRARVTVTLFFDHRIVAQTSVSTELVTPKTQIAQPAWNLGIAALSLMPIQLGSYAIGKRDTGAMVSDASVLEGNVDRGLVDSKTQETPKATVHASIRPPQPSAPPAPSVGFGSSKPSPQPNRQPLGRAATPKASSMRMIGVFLMFVLVGALVFAIFGTGNGDINNDNRTPDIRPTVIDVGATHTAPPPPITPSPTFGDLTPTPTVTPTPIPDSGAPQAPPSDDDDGVDDDDTDDG